MSELNERAKRQIALLAGDDLEGEQSIEARRSVEVCPDCRQHWVRLRGCLDVIERAGRVAEPAPEGSLWPSLERRLRPSTPMRVPQKFNGWIPALSMAAACILLLIVGRLDGPVADRDASSQHEPMMAAGAGQIRWTHAGLRNDLRRASPGMTDKLFQRFGDVQVFVDPGRDRLTTPVSWTLQHPNQ